MPRNDNYYIQLALAEFAIACLYRAMTYLHSRVDFDTGDKLAIDCLSQSVNKVSLDISYHKRILVNNIRYTYNIRNPRGANKIRNA